MVSERAVESVDRVATVGQAVRSVLRGLSLAGAVGLNVAPASAELPQICVTCANGAITRFVTQGAANVVSAGNNMTVEQTTANATLNWQSFNISDGSTVRFQQPDSSSVALNRIYQGSESQIMGRLTANGRVYLLNQNGVVFGSKSRVDVAGLIAGSLDLSPVAVAEGIGNAARKSSTAFELFAGANPTGDVKLLQGAEITTTEGGQVILVAPNVSNAGTIRTPGGQTVLAAGASVYLYSTPDPNLRGLWVEIGSGEGLTNNSGQVFADRGNITLAGAAVNQLGRLSATTSVSQGGSIRLLARTGTSVSSLDGIGINVLQGRQGDLRVGAGSLTSVTLDTSTERSVDSSAQPISRIELDGNRVVLESGAAIVAPHGQIDITARRDGHTDPSAFGTNAEADSRIFVGSGAVIDVSGASVLKSMESNVLSVELRGDELSDSPLQRNGVLRGKTVQVDIRQSGTDAAGNKWVGSPIGDLSGWIANIEKPVAERSLTGGSVRLRSQGDVIVDRGAEINLSGGVVNYADGYVNTSAALGANGLTYDIAEASRDRLYVGLATAGGRRLADARWGVTRQYGSSVAGGAFENGYAEGKDAGTATILGQRVVLNGTFKAETVAGTYQRKPSSTFSSADSAALYRPRNEVPLSGALVLGQTSGLVTGQNGEADFALRGVRFIAGATTPLGVGFDPWSDVLGAGFDTLQLSTRQFGSGAIGRLTLRTNGSVILDPDAVLALPDWGLADVVAGNVDIAGHITSSGGTVRLTSMPTSVLDDGAGGLVLRSGAGIDVSGMWVNDLELARRGLPGTAPLAVDGGQVSLTGIANTVDLQTGSEIDVSGGAWLSKAGRLTAGKGGSVTFSNSPGKGGLTTSLLLNSSLRGFAMFQGGRLDISTAAVCIAADAMQCSERNRTNLLQLSPQLFESGGFGSYALTTLQGGVQLVPGTQLRVAQQNWLPDAALIDVATRRSLSGLAGTGFLPDHQRQSASLSMRVDASLPQDQPYTAATFATAPNLELGKGSRIVTDVGGAVSFQSNTRLLVDGQIDAPAGSIVLKLDSGLNLGASTSPSLYFADQGIWLGSNAALRATGAAVLHPDSQGRMVGDARDGGMIRIDADRGHVTTSTGSLIDVSGTSAILSVHADGEGNRVDTRVGSKGGTLAIEASESFVLGGAIRGLSGAPGQQAAGALQLSLDASGRNDPGQLVERSQAQSAFPNAARTIEVTAQDSAVAFGSSVLPEIFRARATISADRITDGGFDLLNLSARTFETLESGVVRRSSGEIRFAGDVSLNLGRGLNLRAEVLSSSGGTVQLAAPLVSLGNDSQLYQSSLLPTAAGAGGLRVSAGQIDVLGNSVLRGFGAVTLRSEGDLRLMGAAQPGLSDGLLGSFRTHGSLALHAAQVYPTTLSKFVVESGRDGVGALTIAQTGTAANALSVGGQLTLRAPSVVQGGTVRAPFGTLAIESPDIALLAGSLTSTSGAGLTVPFGETQGGLDWAYVLSSQKTLLYGANFQALPSQQINLVGNSIDLQPGSTLNVSGGGDVLATEFIKGTGGKQDILSGDNSFAVLPANVLASAAYDESIYSKSQGMPGVSVYLSGGGGLPAGEYIVLPAKYALLPGAYLVSKASGYQDITASEAVSLTDGSTIVSGYFTSTGTQLRDARTSGFVVLPGKAIKDKANYSTISADEFFSTQAKNADLNLQRLSRDAGTVSIAATSQLKLDGRLLAQGGKGARGAALDIASAAIDVVANAAGIQPQAGVLTLQASDLNSLGAESILLGGSRVEDKDGIKLRTTSSLVSVRGGAKLQAPEVALVATDSVSVEAGSSLTASGAELVERDTLLSGKGAYLRVSTGTAGDVLRTGASNADGAQVNIADDATLSADTGSIVLESSGFGSLSGRLLAAGGELSVTGSRISLGQSSGVTDGWVIGGEQLSGLNLNRLSLNSRGAIDINGDLSIVQRNIGLNAAALRGFGDGVVSFSATDTVSLRGAAATASVPLSTALGKLTLSVNNLLLDGGALSVSGFDSSVLAAREEIRGAADGNLTVQGGLDMSARRLTLASGVDLAIDSANMLSFAAVQSGAALTPISDLGGKLSLIAADIDLASRIELPSGIVNATARTGNVRLRDGAIVDVSGRDTRFADQVVSSNGGSVQFVARTGDVVLESGSVLDFDAAGSAQAGAVSLSAPGGVVTVSGTLSGTSRDAYKGGGFSADARTLDSVAALSARLVQGGITGDLALRQRQGDLQLGGVDELRGTRVELTADQGSVLVAGSIVARDVEGGRILISAGDSIDVSGNLDSRAGGVGERNGRVDLRVDRGGLRVGDSAVVQTLGALAASGSAADGNVNLRVSRDALSTVLDTDATNDQVRLGGDWSRTAKVSLEGFKVYNDSSIDSADVAASAGNIRFADATAFGAQGTAIRSALSNASLPSMNVLAGVEIRSAGALTVNSAWDLSNWRFGGQAGVLNLRAAGDVVFNQSLSDGFTGVSGTDAFRLNSTADSWSYRLVAGADLSSASLTALQRLDLLAPGIGSLRVAAGNVASANGYRMIRTGNGSIDVSAARDISLGNSASMIYTAGIAAAGVNYASSPITGNELGGLKYPSRGGDIRLFAGNDITGAASDQLITDWLWRIGNVDGSTAAATRSTAWTVNFANFQQNVGALGGGDVSVVAGNDINTLSVAIPSIGRQAPNATNDKTAAVNNLEILGSGNLQVTAGRNVLGGVFYAGKGLLNVEGGGSIANSTVTGLSPVLALGDTQAVVRARRNARIETALTPTLLPQDRSQGDRGPTVSNFSTYTPDSRLRVESVAGDASLRGAQSLAGIKALATSLLPSTQLDIALRLLPGTTVLHSLRGDVNLDGSLTLAPTGKGRLEALAYQDVNLNSTLIVSDVDPVLIPGVTAPSRFALDTLSLAGKVLSSINLTEDRFNAEVPVRQDASLAGTLQPSLIVAATGDVSGGDDLFSLQYFGAPVQVQAGNDIINLSVIAQNLKIGDVSSFSAGRDIIYGLQRSDQGAVATDPRQIVVHGPGTLAMSAGRDLNLQNSAGVSTVGNTVNTALGSAGANITVVAGLNGKQPQYVAFASRYLADGSEYSAALIQFMTSISGRAPATFGEARINFATLGEAQRAVFLQQVLIGELRASAVSAASSDPVKNGDYTRGFAALELLLPGSTSAGAVNPYAGDIALYFSRIYTKDGGDISLFAPGGSVNAGLAAPPEAFGIRKTPEQLGIVTQQGGAVGIVTGQDLQVNESRVFAINDSDILVWSSNGDIDAGRGAKTAISAPAPVIAYDRDGYPTVTYTAALAGSGIQTRTTGAVYMPGDVVLAAPRGVVNAGDAGIVAGNLTIAATAVLGADNIKVGGASVGVPVDTGGLGASLAGVAAAASGASSAATGVVGNEGAQTSEQQAPLAAAALSWLDVFVVGLGEDTCKQDDLECLQRQPK
jgi:filamentous hemagglutinin